MFKKILRNKKGQNTAEYAILISLVVAGIIAMQTYAQRALQARVRDAGTYLSDQTSSLGTTDQYEPYYLSTNYTSTRASSKTVILNSETAGAGFEDGSSSTRAGSSITAYTSYGLTNGI